MSTMTLRAAEFESFTLPGGWRAERVRCLGFDLFSPHDGPFGFAETRGEAKRKLRAAEAEGVWR